MSQHKILIDAAPGIAGALAITYAMAHMDLDLLGITTTYGHVQGENALRNSIYLCNLAGKKYVVAEGAHAPIKKTAMRADPDMEGEDGLGNLQFRQKMAYPPSAHTAPRFIADMANTYPGEVTLVCMGPLTNLYMAQKQEPNLESKLKQVVVVGGNIASKGNASPVAEFNIWHDPHAADHIFTSPFQTKMIGLDASRKMFIRLEEMKQIAISQTHVLFDTLSEAASFTTAYHMGIDVELALEEAFLCKEVLGLMYVLHPEWFKMESGRIRVATEGVAEGMTIMDRQEDLMFPQPGWDDHHPKIHAAMQVQADQCRRDFMSVMQSHWMLS
jgi:inosine-uridine nucleoside N-ribohydrolase